jgi:hypothetical protein
LYGGSNGIEVGLIRTMMLYNFLSRQSSFPGNRFRQLGLTPDLDRHFTPFMPI